MEQKKFLQDGDHFYLVDADGTVLRGPFIAPIVVRDHDIEAAKKAREWFIGHAKANLGYEPQPEREEE